MENKDEKVDRSRLTLLLGLSSTSASGCAYSGAPVRGGYPGETYTATGDGLH